MIPALEIVGLSKSFGGLVVSRELSLSIAGGDRIALIGPNGAGKTTLVNLVSGLISPSGGRILLAGRDITRKSPAARVRLGLVRTFQISRLFPQMTAREHVALAILQREGKAGRLVGCIAQMPAVQEEVDGLLGDLGIAALGHHSVGTIAYGEQRLLELAIALALRPKVLLLDEPAAGVPPGDVERVLEAIERLPQDLAVLIVEHDMDLVFRFAQKIVVLANGAIVFEGPPALAAADPKVREAYLGNYAHAGRAARTRPS
jgi:branched-chain amino acid transport system ATP-binding protein